jgi:CheY-like chemotaxis protein
VWRLVHDRNLGKSIGSRRTGSFDLIVSDIGMSGTDGYQLMQTIRTASPEHGGTTPAIALTAYARTEDRLRALRAGYQMHVPKPIDYAELITVMASLVNRRNSSN